MFTGEMSWRRFGSLLSGLPRESTYVVAVRPDLAWGDNEHLLARVVHLLDGANWQRSGGRGAPPKHMRRPGEEDPGFGQGPGHTVEELNAMGITSG